jgi:glycerol-3-phosphate acyltransferase PlsY
MSAVTIVSIIVLCYLVGCFPTGTLIARAYGVNISKQGSGSTGATNVARTVGKLPGILTLLIDILKGFIPAALISLFTSSEALTMLAVLAIVLGHCYSIPPVLKGGKGVASAIGGLLFAAPAIALLGILTFGVSFVLSKIVSLSSILAALVVAIVSFYYGTTAAGYYFLTAMALIVIVRHHPNIKRLLNGEEARFKAKS